jgi:hypothetical protein
MRTPNIYTERAQKLYIFGIVTLVELARHVFLQIVPTRLYPDQSSVIVQVIHELIRAHQLPL